MELIDFYKNLTNTLWGNYGFQALYYFSLVLISIFEHKRIQKAGSVGYSVCILFFIYNPVIYFICKYIFPPESLIAYYCRLFCLVPIVFVIAYALTLVIKQTSGWKRIICTLCMLFIIIFCGHSPYGEEWFAKALNVNKVPEDVLQICRIFQNHETPILIMVPSDLTYYMRQMSSDFFMPYGRNDNPEISNQLQSETPNVPDILSYAESMGTQYIVALYTEESLKQYISWGCEVEGYTNKYVVLRQHYPQWILNQYADNSGSQAMFYTVENTLDGKLFIIDGGWKENADHVRNVIMEKGGIVAGWILTHYHPDHIGAFNVIYQDPQGIEISQIYAPPYDRELFQSTAQNWDGIDNFETFVENVAQADNIIYVTRDFSVTYGNMSISFFNCLDPLLEELEPGDIWNNCSLIFKLQMPTNSFLFCGDCHGAVMSGFLIDRYGTALQADYVQPGHHGNNSLSEEFYDMVNPIGALFDAPEWLMTGDEYKTKDLEAYFHKKGVSCYDYRSAPNQIFLY